ncbi:hypothetical protein D3C78_1753750 [compost metagenome]
MSETVTLPLGSLAVPLKTLAAESMAPVFSRWTSLIRSMMGVSWVRARAADHSVGEAPMTELT